MRSLLPWILAMSCSVYAVGARAEETVLLFELPGLRPELCGALRIQLTDVAKVTCKQGSEDPLPTRLEEAATGVRDAGARLGVLLERDPAPSLVRMLLVGSEPDKAVLAIERIEDRPDPDIDRSLALKVRDTFETVHAAERALEGRRSIAVALVEAPPPRVPRALALELGGGASLARQRRAAALLGVGMHARRGALTLEGLLLAHLTSRIDERVRGGAIDASEWSLSLSARAGRPIGRASLGALLEAGFTSLRAHGRTDAGSEGDARLLRPRTALGLDLRVALARGLSLRFAPALEYLPIAQKFALNGETKLDLGHVRALLPLSLLVEVPIAQRGANHAN